VYSIVEYAGHYKDFLRPRHMNTKGRELGTGIDFQKLRLGSIGTSPQRALTNSRENLPRRDVLQVRRNDSFKIDHHCSLLRTHATSEGGGVDLARRTKGICCPVRDQNIANMELLDFVIRLMLCFGNNDLVSITISTHSIDGA